MPYTRTRWHIREIGHRLLEQSYDRRIGCDVYIPLDVEILIARGNGRRDIGCIRLTPFF